MTTLLAANTVLKGSWVVEKKLGEGACAVVYSVKPTESNTSSRDVEYVAKVVHAPVGKGAVLKQHTVLYNLLYHEYMLHTGHFKGFPHSPQFPLLPRLMYGEEERTNVGKVRYLVMERLGADLEGYVAGLAGGSQPLTPKKATAKKAAAPALSGAGLRSVVSALGVQLVAGLELVHKKGFVFVDVKPGNFMVSVGVANSSDGAQAPALYFIDFALAERYTAATMGSNHRPNLPGGVPKGTPTFMSLAVQTGSQVARRDDLEAAAWVLLSLLMPGQQLPWATAASPTECLRMKKECNLAGLCAQYDCPEVCVCVSVCARVAVRSNLFSFFFCAACDHYPGNAGACVRGRAIVRPLLRAGAGAGPTGRGRPGQACPQGKGQSGTQDQAGRRLRDP
jgi:serine/threonine protein kinase